jgi:hypothetical protein
MDYIPLNTKHRCWLRFIYSCNIYDNILEGAPDVESGVSELQRLKELAAHLSGPHEMITIIGGERVGREILPHRGNLAHIYDGDNRGNVIWFDDGSEEVMQTLACIVDREGFFNLTSPYFI